MFVVFIGTNVTAAITVTIAVVKLYL